MDIPSFRYLEDAVKAINQISEKVGELFQVFKAKKKMLAALITANREEFSINYKPRKKDQKHIPVPSKVVIPEGINKLKSQYALLEDLNEQYQALDAIGAQIEIQFRDNRDLAKAKAELTRAKVKIQDQMKEIFAFLHSIAKAHVPDSFQLYIDAINYELSSNVPFAKSQQFLYVNSSDHGSIVFTNYTVLEDAANADGELATLYVAIQWDMGNKLNKSQIQVFLDHDFELPAKLQRGGTGTNVSTVQDAVRVISNLLELENFSSSLGIIPLSLRLKMDPSALKSELFSYKEYISSVKADDQDSSITFVTRRNSGVNDALAEKIALQLFVEVRGMISRSPNAKMRKRITKANGQYHIKFTMHGIAQGSQMNLTELEFLRDRFGLNGAQLRRVARILQG